MMYALHDKAARQFGKKMAIIVKKNVHFTSIKVNIYN